MRLPYKSMPMPIAVSCDRAEPFRQSRLCFQRFRLTIAWRRVCYQRFEQMMCDMRNFIDRVIECVLVCSRRLSESAQLSNELERRCANFIIRRRRSEVVKCFDGSAHEELLTTDAVVSKVESITRMKTDFLG